MKEETPFERPNEVWLLNLGYVSEHSEQNLLLYGYLSAPGVANVELMVDVVKNHVKYAIVLDARSYKWYKLQRWLEGKSGLLSKLVLLCFLRRLGSYDPAARIARCVKDYAGSSWTTSAEVMSVKQYLNIVGKSGTQGWVFKDGIGEGAGTPGQNRTTAVTTPSR